jgi:hypothetical protein
MENGGNPAPADPAVDAGVRREWSAALRGLPHFYADRAKGNNWRHHRQDLETWAILHQVHLIANVEMQKMAVCSSLRGHAHRAVQLHGRGQPTFNNAATIRDYLDVLQTVFQPEAETQLARQDFLAREQGIVEPVSEYLADKFALYFASMPVEANRSYRDLKEQCLKGLKSHWVQNEVITKNPQSEEALLQVCATAVGQARQAWELKTGMVSNLDGLASTTMPNRYLADRGEAMEVDRVGGEDRDCYKCGKKGHLARDCPSKVPARGGQGRGREGPGRGEQGKIVCYYCGNKGHKKPDCRALKKDKQAGKVHPDKIAKTPAKKHQGGAQRVGDEDATDEDADGESDESDADEDFGDVGAIYDPEDWSHPAAPGFWNLAGLRSFRQCPPRR